MDKMCGKLMGRKSIKPLGERKNDCTLTKSHIITFHILCDMGLPCSILNNINLRKDRNIIYFYSFQKVHKYFDTK